MGPEKKPEGFFACIMNAEENDNISRKRVMEQLCDVMPDFPANEFQEGEMAGVIRAMKVVKHTEPVKTPETKTGPTIRPASLATVIATTCNTFSLYPARYSEEDVLDILRAVIDAGYVIGRKEEE